MIFHEKIHLAFQEFAFTLIGLGATNGYSSVYLNFNLEFPNYWNARDLLILSFEIPVHGHSPFTNYRSREISVRHCDITLHKNLENYKTQLYDGQL
jgi:hypothetical protein